MVELGIRYKRGDIPGSHSERRVLFLETMEQVNKHLWDLLEPRFDWEQRVFGSIITRNFKSIKSARFASSQTLDAVGLLLWRRGSGSDSRRRAAGRFADW
ncbi:MAG: hypothetical protein PHS44_00365 [Candidatus Dojkabacteria bacterium]|nr:hypothetical protein [Candidatus Dojkabacteria bacterium]